MIIGSRQKFTANNDNDIKVVIDNNEIDRVNCAKSLGVTIDKNLNWAVHINNVVKKVSSAIGALKRVRPFITFDTAVMVYKSLILPHFDYCSVVWGGISQYLSDKLQKMQNRAARVVTQTGYETRSHELLERLCWDKLSIRRDKQKAMLMFKTARGLVPTYIQNLFNSKETSYQLRNKENSLSLPLPRTEFLKNSFSYSGAALWNKLSQATRSAPSVKQFKLLVESDFP